MHRTLQAVAVMLSAFFALPAVAQTKWAWRLPIPTRIPDQERGSVVDGFAYNFKRVVPYDTVYDCSATSHAVHLFDIASKYADVATTAEVLEMLRPLGKAPAA
jgi:hypothetical protein